MKNYDKDISINQEHLDLEWLKQASLFMHYAEKVAQAILKRDKMKEHQEYIRAKLSTDIRTYPNIYGIEKITEAAVLAEIGMNHEMRKAIQNTIDATDEVNILQLTLRALEHKKKALEYLSQLWIGNYHSSPREQNHEKQRGEEATSGKIREKVKRG